MIKLWRDFLLYGAFGCMFIIMSRNSFRVNLHFIICMNVKELLGQIKESNGIRTYNHLVRKRTFNHLAKTSQWLNGWVFVYKLSVCEFESSCSQVKFSLMSIISASAFWIFLILLSWQIRSKVCLSSPKMMKWHFYGFRARNCHETNYLKDIYFRELSEKKSFTNIYFCK